jgi:hypothetical protein
VDFHFTFLENSHMACNTFENQVVLDDHTVKYPYPVKAENKPSELKRLKKSWEGVKSDLNGLAGISLGTPDFEVVVDAVIKSGTGAVHFELTLNKSEFRLDVLVDKLSLKAGSVKVPTELEAYRTFLSLLNGWSNPSRDIVPDADFKKFNADNPKRPEKPKLKDYDDLVKKGKADMEAFRTWAKGDSSAKKALEAIDKTAKAKPTDPARIAALKDINRALQAYLKTFD